MQRLLVLLLFCYVTGGQANRVYIHPFHLFAADNVTCETLQTETDEPLETLPVAPLDAAVLTPDSRDPSKLDGQRQNITQRTAVLAELLNTLGLRIYQALSSKQQNGNTLFSPVHTYGSLFTFYFGASKKTAKSFQLLLGVSRDTDPKDCVSLLEGQRVHKTLQTINSFVNDEPENEVATQVWAFTGKDTQLSADFVQGTQDVSDQSFIRGVDFSNPEEAEQLVNSYMAKTSDGKVESVFTDLNSSSNLLFLNSFNFQGKWRRAFQPEKTSLQDFYLDESTTVKLPLMTQTGRFHYLNDKERRCTVVKLPLRKRSYMLLVLPHKGAKLNDIESRLRTDIMSSWRQNLREGLLELSLPKFALAAVTDLRDLLTTMGAEVEAKLLGSESEFSRLSNTKPFGIDQAFNRVLFEMSEEGAEPQEEIPEAGVPLKLSINRPFFFSVIGDANTILLLGKLTNPTL